MTGDDFICKVHSDTRCHSFSWLPLIVQPAYMCAVNVIFMGLFIMSVEETWEDSYVRVSGIKNKGI